MSWSSGELRGSRCVGGELFLCVDCRGVGESFADDRYWSQHW